MNRVLCVRSLRDSWLLLAMCCLLTLVFMGLRIWFTSRIKIEHLVSMLADGLSLFENLLPVPIQDWISPLGRTAFSYEELPVILLLGLWTVARASDCVAGRIENGTMEMLLAQPLRRISLVTSHSVVSLAGVAILGTATLAGLGLGLAVSRFDPRPAWTSLLPAMVNYIGFGAFLLGAATLLSAVVRTRSQVIAIMIAFYVVELALLIVARLSQEAAWLENFTILAAYEPTLLSLGLNRNAGEYWPLFWQYNAWLYGLGGALWAAAAATFCHRDVPAPL
jgi:ABC-type transport system involved in multi-copper enzyme maturation permease subunit